MEALQNELAARARNLEQAEYVEWCVYVCVSREVWLPKKSTAESCDYHMICMMQ